MNRLRLLAAAALLAVPLINACGEEIAPTPLGTISGQVVIEGEQQAGVTVKLNTGATATTTSTGSFSFADVEANTYTVTISGFAEDGSFDKTSQSATITNDGQKVTVDFTGSWIRTSAITGEVTVEGTGLEGVTVKLTGMSEGEVVTSATGAYSFTGLRAGVHTVEISGFDDEDIGFSATTSVADVAIGATEQLHFQASYLRASAVMGQVTIEGEALAGVTVSLQGVDRDLEVGTNSGGQFNFTELRKGDYAVAISGYDTDKYGFEVTSQTITVAYGESAEADFDGIDLRTATVSGVVTIEGTGLEGVTVSLTGEGAQLSMVTDAAGQWTFAELHAGSYSIGISGYDMDEYGFDETSASVTVALKETATADFDGIMLRTAAISGHVSIGGEPLPGITITVNGRDEEHTRTTDPAGNYAVDRLHAGDYTVTISGFDDDLYDFDPTVKSVSVGLRETADIGFDGIMLRTVEIMGTVTVDGEPLAGVTVTISGGREGQDETVMETTDMMGEYSAGELHAGEYTITVTNPDDDEYEFVPASQTIMAELNEMVQVDFPGIKLRTGGIMGTVTTDGEALAGVTVTVSGGRADETVMATTDMEGMYSLDRLHAGEYTVAVTNPDEDEYEFDPASQMVMVALKETATADFPGIKLRTVGIHGTVAAEGNPLADVTVTVSGGRADETVMATTDGEGMYSLDRLHAGDYTVTISGYDENEYEFDPASQTIMVELLDMVEVSFENGILLRTASISGRVTMDGDAADGLTLTLSSDGEDDAEMETNSNGQYNFPGLPAGDYTLEISGYDTAEYEYTPESVEITLVRDSAKIQNFAGRSLRTVVITGSVTAEEEMIAGAVAGLYRVVSLTEVVPVPGGIQLTDSMGEFTFDGLLDDWYAVVISGYDDEYDFPKIPLAGQQFVAWSGYVATDDTVTVDFVGTIIRTAMIGGMVTADGDPMEDVEVMIEGKYAPEDNTMMTDADGEYMFDGLRKGDYTISITNPDAEMYDFPTTESEVNVSVGQVQDDVSFDGSVLRGASISGQVHAEGSALEGVAVVLSGDADDSTTTDANGEYNFPTLAAGDYAVSITNPDEDRYSFDVTEMDVDDLGSAEARIVDFSGTHIYDASISGMLYLDEDPKNGKRDDDEPVFEGAVAAMVKLNLEDGYGNTWSTSADSTGAYEFMGLKAGTYTLMHDTASDGDLYDAGYAFTGDSLGVEVELTGTSEETVDLPYGIFKQTLNIGAVMANNDTTTETGVEGVAYEVYPNLKAAQDGEDMLGGGTTAENGMAAVTFLRADDYGVGGPETETDGVVIIAVNTDDSDYHEDLTILDPSNRYEALFAFTERTTDANGAVKLINTTASFGWSVMSADMEVGGEPLAGWWTTATGGDFADAMAAGSNGSAMASESDIPVDDIPKEYTLMVPDSVILLDSDGDDSVVFQPDTTGEAWASETVSYTHTGLDLPDADMADAGTVSVNWTTQSLYLGFYREVDGVAGFTRNWIGGGDVVLDHRPASNHLHRGVDWTFRHKVGARFETFEWDHDDDGDKEGADDAGVAEWVEVNESNYWLVRFPRIPTGTLLEVNLEIGTNKSQYEEGSLGRESIDAFDLSGVTGVFNTFGANGGGHSDVWLCVGSSGDITPANGHDEGRDGCVTYGYQWENNTVDVAFWPRKYKRGEYERTTRLTDSMTVELHGIVPDVAGAKMTANVHDTLTTAKTVKSHDWDELNDGVYVLSTEKTGEYELDYFTYRYGSRGDYEDDRDLDSTYVDTLWVFYQEHDNGDYEEEYDRETVFKVSPSDATLNATLAGLTIDGDTVIGFDPGEDGDSYKMTVGWDRDSVKIVATTTDPMATATIVEADTTARKSVSSYVRLRGEKRTTPFTVTGKATGGGETETATYTVNIYRTDDRVKVTDTTRVRGVHVPLDSIEVREGFPRAVRVGTGRNARTVYMADTVELEVSLWADPTADVAIAWRDSSWTFTSTSHAPKTYTMIFGHWGTAGDADTDPGREDDNGEDEDSTWAIEATGGGDGEAGTTTLVATFVDNDEKLFLGPTEISAIGGAPAEFRTRVKTTLSTLPVQQVGEVDADVDLEIEPADGGEVAPEDVTLTSTAWRDAGIVFNVFGEVPGNDFEISVTAEGGGYDDVDYPDIDVNWIDSLGYALVVSNQEVNIVVPEDTLTDGTPMRPDTTRVFLWRRGATDGQNDLILDGSVDFDSLDLARGCPKWFSCVFGTRGTTVSLDQTTFSLDVVVAVTEPDSVAKYHYRNYEVEFIGTESDEEEENGYFIDPDADEEDGGEIEREYAIRFDVLDKAK
ncbi:MAG: carboxypeptidase regulatory-like domain-containing protein [Gemmatimonadetes bacterium]|nr:carboxypeptidase regulatory-like domain-containing protein [Gemmatimonadota bacterium]